MVSQVHAVKCSSSKHLFPESIYIFAGNGGGGDGGGGEGGGGGGVKK